MAMTLTPAKAWTAVRRFGARYPVWAGAAGVVGVALVVGGGQAVVNSLASSGANSTVDANPSASATSSDAFAASPFPLAATPSLSEVPTSSDPEMSPSPGEEYWEGGECDLGGVDGCPEDDPNTTLLWPSPMGGLRISADGSTLLYILEDTATSAVGDVQAYAINLSTLEKVRLGRSGFSTSHFAISPDGRSVATMSPFGTCSTTTGECTSIGSSPISWHDGSGIEWSPDSSRFVFTACPSGSSCPFGTPAGSVIAVVTPAAARVEVIADGAGAHWSHDGTRLAWLRDSDGDGDFGVWMRVVDGGIPEAVTSETVTYDSRPLWWGEPSWSRDDARLAVPTQVGTAHGVDVVALDGSPTRTVTGLGENSAVWWIGWSADDAYLAVVTEHVIGGNLDVGYVHVAPSSSLVATKIEGSAGSFVWRPAWSPVGHRLVAVEGPAANNFADRRAWVEWSGGQSRFVAVLPHCSSFSPTPVLVPRPDGSAPTQAVGGFMCGDEPLGLYLVNLSGQ